jgi:hypothetical protein
MVMIETTLCIGFRARGLPDRAHGRAADVVQRRDERAPRRRLNDRFERGEHALAVALSERNEAHARRNQIGCDRVEECVQSRFERDAVPAAATPTATG